MKKRERESRERQSKMRRPEDREREEIEEGLKKMMIERGTR